MNLNYEIKQIVDKYDKNTIDCIGMFGSRARGDYSEDSDYDIFLIGDINLDTQLRIEDDLEKVIKKNIDIIHINKNTDKILLKNIMNEAIIIYNKDNAFDEIYNFIEDFFVENSDFLYIRRRELLD